jgi:calcium-binding protein CML
MESGDRDSLEPMSREAAKILGHIQREKPEIEELNASGSTTSAQVEDGVSNGLPDCQLVKDLTEVFKIFDKNGDGKISQAELGLTLLSLGEKPTAEELHRMVKEVDADGDGEIDLKEFIYLNTVGLGGADEENGDGHGASAASIRDAIQDAFQVFDLDKNGFISADELLKVLTGLGDNQLTLDDCRNMIKSVDKDGDERVDFTEFQQMMSGGFVY